MPLPRLPCSQTRMIALIWPSWGVSIPCWRLNEKLLYSYFYAEPKFVSWFSCLWLYGQFFKSMGKLSWKRVAHMNEVCKIKPFMISITLGIGLIRHPWFTRVILLASKGQFTWVRTVRMGPSGATITTVMYLTSLRSQQFSNVLQALYAATELWEENRPWAQVHFCFTDYGPSFTLYLDSSSPHS